MIQKVINWILKEIFYFRYLILKQGDLEVHLLHRTLANCRHIAKLTPSFESYSFDDLQWNRFLPWYKDSKAFQDWNTYGIFKQQYGKFYFKAKLDGLVTDKGWPAIWMLELKNELDKTYYFEIDIELFRDHFGYTIWSNPNGEQNMLRSGEIYRSLFANRKLRRNLQKEDHLFLIDWSEKWIKFYINGILSAKFRNEIKVPMQIICSKLSMSKVIVQK